MQNPPKANQANPAKPAAPAPLATPAPPAPPAARATRSAAAAAQATSSTAAAARAASSTAAAAQATSATAAPATVRAQLGLRLEAWHRRSVYACVAFLFATGAAWLIARYFFRPVAEFGETIHPLEPLAMKLHGAAAMATLFFLGTLLNAHIRGAIKTGRNRISGWSMVASMAVLTVTGFGLYYLASESNRPTWSAIHWVLGIAASLLLVLHVLLGRRRGR